MDIRKKLGKKIQQIRKNKNLTQEILAEKIQISILSLSKIETGKSFPSPDTLSSIAEALNVELSWLFEFEENLNSEIMLDEIQKKLDLYKNNASIITAIYKYIKTF